MRNTKEKLIAKLRKLNDKIDRLEDKKKPILRELKMIRSQEEMEDVKNA